MITTNGKLHVKKYLAGIVPVIGASIGYGLGDQAATLGDIDLQFEIDRSDVNLVSYDYVQNKLIFKTNIPETFGGKIYEVGLFSKTGNGYVSSKMVTTFDSATETWLTGSSAATFASVNTRIGSDSLSHSPAANGSSTSYLSGLNLDFSENPASDTFVFAYNLGNAFTSSIRFRFLTDASNYYDFTVNTAMTAGYKVVSRTKGSAITTGSPNWSSISEIQVTTNSTAGGASAVEFDGVRINDLTIQDPNYVLVARTVVTPFTKVRGQVQEIEFALDVVV